MMRRLPKMIHDGSNSAFQPTLMLPISRYVPSGAVMPGVDLREGAVHARRHRVGDRGRQLEHRVVRAEIEVLAEAALEVRPLLARDEPVRLPHRAGLEVPRETRFAAAAREEIAIGDAITERQRAPGGVRRHAVAELGDRADVLVAGVERQRSTHACVVLLAAPVVQVGAAHVRERDLDERGPGLRLGHRVFADLEGLARPVEYRQACRLGHGGPPLWPVSYRNAWTRLARLDLVDILDERANLERLCDVVGEIEVFARRLQPLDG